MTTVVLSQYGAQKTYSNFWALKETGEIATARVFGYRVTNNIHRLVLEMETFNNAIQTFFFNEVAQTKVQNSAGRCNGKKSPIHDLRPGNHVNRFLSNHGAFGDVALTQTCLPLMSEKKNSRHKKEELNTKKRNIFN